MVLFFVQVITCSYCRSKSCPQCRNKTTEKTIHRIYFNVASSEPEEDASLLRNKIDNLTFQIHLKDTDIKNAAEECKTLNNQNKGLRLVIHERYTYNTYVKETIFNTKLYKWLQPSLNLLASYFM
jgi:hypothetical protein